MALLYIKAITDSLSGYRAELLLFIGLCRICASNNAFRDRVSQELQEKEGKRMLKDLKTWAKDVSMNLSHLVRGGRLGFWRRP